ncbi:VOC family protein [Aestuariivivens sediminis]|uniref:VOC family protein n=1 Tax=Aestuariivivens sediminis TaxID=2913557 RepID=UPI001F57C0AE|nr:hypothetical protein [Aestuariivivens sediminis]
MKNDKALIGLFQGMFDQNRVTFNPGWDESGTRLEAFTDVRDIQRQLKQHAIKLERECDEKTSGPTSMVLYDPDGNTILIDQHV